MFLLHSNWKYYFQSLFFRFLSFFLLTFDCTLLLLLLLLRIRFVFRMFCSFLYCCGPIFRVLNDEQHRTLFGRCICSVCATQKCRVQRLEYNFAFEKCATDKGDGQKCTRATYRHTNNWHFGKQQPLCFPPPSNLHSSHFQQQFTNERRKTTNPLVASKPSAKLRLCVCSFVRFGKEFDFNKTLETREKKNAYFHSVKCTLAMTNSWRKAKLIPMSKWERKNSELKILPFYFYSRILFIYCVLKTGNCPFQTSCIPFSAQHSKNTN